MTGSSFSLSTGVKSAARTLMAGDSSSDDFVAIDFMLRLVGASGVVVTIPNAPVALGTFLVRRASSAI